MSKISDVLIGFYEAFGTAKNGYDYWIGKLEQNGYDADNAIAAAQYYDQMIGIAKAAEEIVSPSPLKDYLDGIKPRLYKEDYE